jgi:hypothetical protein
MPRSNPLLFAAFLALGLGATGAFAATDAPTLDQACPGLKAGVQEVLAPVVQRLNKSGRVEARFELADGKPAHVTVDGQPVRYQHHVKHALEEARCVTPEAASATSFTLEVEFRDS